MRATERCMENLRCGKISEFVSHAELINEFFKGNGAGPEIIHVQSHVLGQDRSHFLVRDEVEQAIEHRDDYLGIEPGGRLVEEEHAWIAQERAG